MNKLFITLICFALGCVGLLIWQVSQTDLSVVLLPSDLAKDSTNRQRIRLAGRVAPETVDYQLEPELLLKFSIHDPGKTPSLELPTIKVLYKGLKPDMFRAGSDLILDGEWKEGTFVASKLMTQCPSKYEPPKPGESNLQQNSEKEVNNVS